MINKKSLISYPNYLKDVFNEISFDKDYNIIGTSSIRGMLYAADYDLNMQLFEKDAITHINNLFHKLFLNISKNPDIYFMDFKLGGFHWTLSEVLKGSKNKLSFKDGLQDDKNRIKLDIIARLNYAEFSEISMIYTIDFEKKTIDEHHESVKNKLSDDLNDEISEYVKDGDYYKALKRLFTYFKINKDESQSKLLFNLFNSSLGILYKTKSNVEILLKLSDKYHMNLNELKHSLQSQKDYLNNIVLDLYTKHLFEQIDEICLLKAERAFNKKLKILYDEINKLLQKQTIKWIYEHKQIKEIIF